jgi:hypothetical protein
VTDEALATALLNFRSSESSPRLRPDPYHLRGAADQIRSAFANRHLDKGFATRLKTALVDGLYHLDALPRADPFWEGTNRRPTLGKLFDFAEYVLGRSPGEAWALWALAAVRLLYCCNDFGLDAWRRMHPLGALDASWPVYGALLVRFDSGFETAPALIHFLNETGRCAEARNALERLEGGGDEGLTDWVKRIRKGCPVRIDPAWLAWNGGLIPKLAAAIFEERAFDRMPVLGDALEEAGCTDGAILGHCRWGGEHTRGCWLVDSILGRG